jgi:hypothetical protein
LISSWSSLSLMDAIALAADRLTATDRMSALAHSPLMLSLVNLRHSVLV